MLNERNLDVKCDLADLFLFRLVFSSYPSSYSGVVGQTKMEFWVSTTGKTQELITRGLCLVELELSLPLLEPLSRPPFLSHSPPNSSSLLVVRCKTPAATFQRRQSVTCTVWCSSILAVSSPLALFAPLTTHALLTVVLAPHRPLSLLELFAQVFHVDLAVSLMPSSSHLHGRPETHSCTCHPARYTPWQSLATLLPSSSAAPKRVCHIWQSSSPPFSVDWHT
jgi:hypothetical protein